MAAQQFLRDCARAFPSHPALVLPPSLPSCSPGDDLFGVCWNGGFAYAMTEGAKMILMATLLPGSDDMTFVLSQELFKAVLRGCGDLLGMYLVLKKARARTSQKILAIGLGWACAESVFRILLPLWTGARGMQFSWEFMHMSIESNISALLTITLVALAWMLALGGAKSRSAERVQQERGPLLLFIATIAFMPVVSGYGVHALGINAWVVLVAQAASAGIVAFAV